MSLLGVGGHFLHNDLLYTTQDASWRLENTLPVVKKLGVATVCEQIYALLNPYGILVSGGATDPTLLQKMADNRALVSGWLGQYDAAGISITLDVQGYPPTTTQLANVNVEFAAWIAELIVAHSCIKCVQFHNEPDSKSFWNGTVQQYIDVYRAFAATLKAAKPDIILSGGTTSNLWWATSSAWLTNALKAGLLDFCDAVSVHPYHQDYPPEVDSSWRVDPVSDPDHMEKALKAWWAKIQAYNTTGKPLKMYCTEFGWQTGWIGPGHVDEMKQADYLSRAIMIFMDVRLRGVPIESVYWYDLKDDGTPLNDPILNYGRMYGLTSPDLTVEKRAFTAYKAIISYFKNTDNFEAVDLPLTATGLPTLKLKTWRRKSDGATIIPFWNADAAKSSSQTVTIPLTIPLLGTVRRCYSDGRGSTPVTTTITGTSMSLNLSVSPRADWLEIKP